MKRVLVLLSASFPFGRGESFLAAEMPWLEAAFDEVVVLARDTTTPDARPVGEGVRVVRVPPVATAGDKAASLLGLLSPTVWRELWETWRRRPRPASPRPVVATVLVSWQRARLLARRIREVAAAHPGARVHAYAYWADDGAVAAALARREGWVERAWARAHGWDVYPGRRGVAHLPFRDFLGRHLDHLFFVSEDGRRTFRAMTGRDHPSTEVAHLGSPGGGDAPVARSRPFTLVSCSSMVPVKRVDLLARALGRAPVPVRWVHVGDGPERPAVEAACRALPGRVAWTLEGHVPHDRVLALYRELRPTFFVNVSESEGIPVSMMEAMSLGIPVLATGVGGVPEIVEDGANGFLMEPDADAAAVAAAVEACVALPEEEHGRLARGALATWRERFRAETNFARFVERVTGEGAAAAGAGRPGGSGGSAP